MHEFTVSELSLALRRTVEERYPYVRVRGELGRVSRPASGHIYLDLKDEKAVLNGVIWKGVAARLGVRPEQGLEVIATGKLTTFAGQSRYQIVIERLEPAGVGALMALLEARKKKLAAEGLFDAEKKRKIPFLPRVIGVVTSPTGAVIRDILHRLSDRFASHVLVWPVRVQGESCAAEVAAGIEGFNALEEGGKLPRPDLIIVARGGGSLEDLWGFNEEIVVRAAAASTIPLISAVGHETDWTLIDYAADERAPTPTAAAERAVPVRADLLLTVDDLERRLRMSLNRLGKERRAALTSALRALPAASDLLAMPRQRLDTAAQNIGHALRANLAQHRSRFERLAGRVSLGPLAQRLAAQDERLDELGERMRAAAMRLVKQRGEQLNAQGQLLLTLGYKNVLARGYALVRDEAGAMIRSANSVSSGDRLEIEFADGRVRAMAGSASRRRRKKPRAGPPDDQGLLL
ncbi:MAG TPA: exodeoxyribonuclease VII large subunit [Rhizobiales bacterium]|nr:exodeoxyribonuclease VII large subunit [Hyphomicrobiales bacterium]